MRKIVKIFLLLIFFFPALASAEGGEWMLFGREGECSSIENFANHRNEKSHLFKGVSNPDQLAEKIKSLGGSPVIKKESEDFIMVNEDSMGVGVIFIKKEMCKEIISGPR